MPALRPDTIGILPAGALGVAFFYHLTSRLKRLDGSVFFVERRSSASGSALRLGGKLRIHDGTTLQELPSADLLRPDVLSLYETGDLPELLLVCPNPDQLLAVLDTVVRLVERIHASGALQALPVPWVVLCSNGIYFARTRQLFIEKLEESTLFGRLPDLWPELMPRLVGKLLRGVTIQTGTREGSGADAIYHPGPRGLTRVAGGDANVRQRVVELCTACGGYFANFGALPPTRVEFDKAFVNLAGNVLGLLAAIDDDGMMRVRTAGELFTAPREPLIRELVHHVLAVGRAVRAYGPEHHEDELVRHLFEIIREHADHVPSSLQWVALQLRRGCLEPVLTPTEQWLLEPLERFARSAHLPETAAYFAGLRASLLEKLRRACARQPTAGSARQERGRVERA